MKGTSATLRSAGFRPLAGCRLFHGRRKAGNSGKSVSVPLRGVDCFCTLSIITRLASSFRPLTGCGLFRLSGSQKSYETSSFRPLAGCGLFQRWDKIIRQRKRFPSPCGVWVVSAKLHILSGATGKRIVNSAILLYHIGRWFINSKLRNCKVPCEAHKTAT